MSYRRYVAGLKRRRACLRAKLEEANHVRLGHLPLHDIDRVLDDQVPIMTKVEHATGAKEQRGFARFKRAQLDLLITLPNSPLPTDWQAQRARVMRRVFVEHQIQKSWLAISPT